MRRMTLVVTLCLVVLGLVGAPVALAHDSEPAFNCPAALPGANFYAPPVAGTSKTVALTFDDGPGPSTAAILRILRENGVRATFFNIGEQEAQWPNDVVAEEEDGFLIGDHTWSHPDLTTLSLSGQAAQLDRVISEQRSLVGTAPCVLRPPYGDYNSTTLQLARARHLSVWMWSVDTTDWEAEGSGASYWVERIIDLAESEGGVLDHPVVLMHNQAIPMPATVAALPTIIQYFKDHGYTFVDLLGRTGPPQGCGSGPPANPGGVRIDSGGRLLSGEEAGTADGQYSLVMQRDGNLVLYTGSRPLWESGTDGHPGATGLMEKNGDFVVVSKSGRVLWNTKTSGHVGASLVLENDGNLSLEAGASILWSSRSWNDSLAPSEALHQGWYLLSNDSACRLTLSRGGNLVLSAPGGPTIWQTRPHGGRGDEAVMEGDGDLVIRSRTGHILWSTATAGRAGASLYVSRDGAVFVETAAGDVAWFR